mgnify:CR=1 FL=1
MPTEQFFSHPMQCKTGEIDVRFATASMVIGGLGHNKRCANEEKKKAEATTATDEAEAAEPEAAAAAESPVLTSLV